MNFFFLPTQISQGNNDSQVSFHKSNCQNTEISSTINWIKGKKNQNKKKTSKMCLRNTNAPVQGKFQK
jgi:hypothetical protein